MIYSKETVCDDFNPPQPRYFVEEGQVWEQWVVRPGEYDAGIVPWEDVFKALSVLYRVQEAVDAMDVSLDTLEGTLPERILGSEAWSLVQQALGWLWELVECNSNE